MEEFTVEEVIGYQIEIIRASGVEGDRRLEGRLLNPGNLDYVITTSETSPTRLRERRSSSTAL